MIKLIFLFFSIYFTQFSFANSKGEIQILITNIKNNSGYIYAALLKKNATLSSAFNENKAVKRGRSEITEQKAYISFKNISYDEYIIAIFHDENNNQKLEKNFIGIPREGVAFSNNISFKHGPPKLSNAIFKFKGKKLSLKINMIYP